MLKQKTYTPEAINNLAKAIDGDEDAYTWLNDNHLKELAAFHDVFIHQNESAILWLKKHEYHYLINFYYVLNKNTAAQKLLLAHPDKEWALAAAASNNERGALNTLIKNDLKHFGYLALMLNKVFSYGSDALGAIGGFGGSIGGSGGFGGFGGGSFGGGGAGGSW